MHQGQERDPSGAGVWGAEAQLCGAELLGPGIFRFHGRSRRRDDTSVHPSTGSRGQALRSAESLAIHWPPSGGPKGRVAQQPVKPL